jgi:hypothetical protein
MILMEFAFLKFKYSEKAAVYLDLKNKKRKIFSFAIAYLKLIYKIFLFES